MATKKTTTKKPATKAAAKPAAKKATVKKATKPARTSALDAAVRVLSETSKPLTSREMIEAMAAKSYWKSPGGKTPHATLYSAILREIAVKKSDARFKKTERGKFTVRKG